MGQVARLAASRIFQILRLVSAERRTSLHGRRFGKMGTVTLSECRRNAKAKMTPKYIVCDRGRQFDCDGFRDWCRRKGIQPPRYGAIGRHGSIAVVERFILTMKCLLLCLPLVPYRRDRFQREIDAIAAWYNGHRPHTWLGGKTPDEVYHGRYPANRRPRFEPRPAWPRGSPCAKPWAVVKGKAGARLELAVTLHAGRKHLPIVRLRRVA